jgi:hypothetical protein
MQKGVVGGRSCVVELYPIWTPVEGYVESVRLVAVAELWELIRGQIIVLRLNTEAQTTIWGQQQFET